MNCLVYPLLLPCCVPGCHAANRVHLAEAYGFDDQIGQFGACLAFHFGLGADLM